MIHIRLPKCLVVLTPGEVMTMLRNHPDIWARALRRGKHQRRADALARRTPKSPPQRE